MSHSSVQIAPRPPTSPEPPAPWTRYQEKRPPELKPSPQPSSRWCRWNKWTLRRCTGSEPGSWLQPLNRRPRPGSGLSNMVDSFHSDSAAAMAALNAVGEEGRGVPSVNSRYVTGLCSTPRWMVLTSSGRSAGPPPCPPPPAGLLCPVLPRLLTPPWVRPGLCCRTGWCRPALNRDTGKDQEDSFKSPHKHKLDTRKLSGSPWRPRQELFSY